LVGLFFAFGGLRAAQPHCSAKKRRQREPTKWKEFGGAANESMKTFFSFLFLWWVMGCSAA